MDATQTAGEKESERESGRERVGERMAARENRAALEFNFDQAGSDTWRQL